MFRNICLAIIIKIFTWSIYFNTGSNFTATQEIAAFSLQETA